MKYYYGDYSYWDSKITTFPGLYLISSTSLKIISNLLEITTGNYIECSVSLLRTFNHWFAFISVFLYMGCRQQVIKVKKKKKIKVEKMTH